MLLLAGRAIEWAGAGQPALQGTPHPRQRHPTRPCWDYVLADAQKGLGGSSWCPWSASSATSSSAVGMPPARSRARQP
jgi:hypothetical protein